VILVYGIFINLQNYGVDQNYVQRYMIARNEKEAIKSAFWGGMLYIPVSLLFLFIGTCLFAFYNSGAAVLPLKLQGTGKGDLVFPHFIVNELPAGITGLMISSIFAAGMSTISTSFNSAATVILTNIIPVGRQRSMSDRRKMLVLYASTILVSLIGISVGIAMINVKSALDAWWKLASVFSGGMLGLFLLGVFSRQRNVRGALTGTLVGLLVIMYLSLSDFFSGPDTTGIRIHTYLTIVLGTVTIFLVGFLVGMISRNKNS
jgi:SSS family solute:Na+ symporter